METVQTVDVSWLHHSHRGYLSRTKSAPSVIFDKAGGSVGTPHESPVLTTPILPSRQSPFQSTSESPDTRDQSERIESDPDTVVNDDTLSGHKGTDPPNTLTRGTPRSVAVNRRNSWISTLSSKLSGGSTPLPQNAPKASLPNPKQAPTPAKADTHNPFGAAYSPKDKDEMINDSSNSSNTSSPRNGHPSFLQNALRRFSSGNTGLGRLSNNGTTCQRRVMNIDHNRDRCKVPELDQAKLKRVAFCVDVEIAGVSCREDDENSEALSEQHLQTQPQANKRPGSKSSDSRIKDKEESMALKSDQATTSNNDINGASKVAGKEPKQKQILDRHNKTDNQLNEPSKKHEKKRSEEERKERREKMRRQAEANGSVPLQLAFDNGNDLPRPQASSKPHSKAQNRPTTDPVRIYRRCCQLRESPILRKLVERISSPSSVLAECPGTVTVLDLTDFPMSLQDIVTFSDWLAIVPVRKLVLENCSLTDEGVRSILAGLLSTKTMEQARKKVSQASSDAVDKQGFGVVEKLSLKNNPQISPEGWRHICLFLHLSKSLRAIDLSGIPFPKSLPATGSPGALTRSLKPTSDIAATFACALANRFAGNHLEELLLSECKPSTEDVGKICDAAVSMGLRRLGVASNGLTREGIEHVVRYFGTGKCEGLDLGGNDLNDHLGLLTSAINGDHPLYALSLADCSLTPTAICPLLQAFTRLPNFRFIDLSHNPALFSQQPDALVMLRRFLPKMPWLKRIHLEDVDLSPDHAIALAEILPECPSLCHLNILENPKIASLSSAKEPGSQEEACAVYTSLMTAVRVSRTIIAVDIEPPSADSNEIVKALASQMMAYSLRNLEQKAIEEDISNPVDVTIPRPQVPVPEVLQHLVGHGNVGDTDADEDEAAPDEDYVIGGTGVVKALGVCLGNADQNQFDPGDLPTPVSDASTPIHSVSRPITVRKPRDMSKNLLDAARNIRVRIQSALVREDRAGNDTNYRRLQFLDMTLQKMIQRFEDEYPETRIILETSQSPSKEDSLQSLADGPHGSTMTANSPCHNADRETAIDDEDIDQYAVKLSRRASNTSLYSRAMTSEEGHIHRISQNLRRDLLNPALEQHTETFVKSSDDSTIAALRERMQQLGGDEIRSRVESMGPDQAFRDFGSTVEELWLMQRQDIDAFRKFKESQIAAQINSDMRPRSPTDSAVDGSSLDQTSD